MKLKFPHEIRFFSESASIVTHWGKPPPGVLASYYSTAQIRVLILRLSIHIFDNLSMKATDNNLGTQIPDTQVRNQDDPKLIFLAPGFSGLTQLSLYWSSWR